MDRSSCLRARPWPARLFGALVAFALGAAVSAGACAQDRAVQELMRKAAAGEDDSGFCATTGWKIGNADTNRAFREGAVVGSVTFDNFANGTCATARVIEVSSREGRKCIRYNWFACQPGHRCANGTTLTCQSATGEWEDTLSARQPRRAVRQDG